MQDHHAADRLKSTTIGVIEGWGQQPDWFGWIGATSGDLLTTNHGHRNFLSLFNFSKTACVDEKSCIWYIPSRLSLNSSFVSLSINYCSFHPYLVASLYSILASTSFHTVPYGTSGGVGWTYPLVYVYVCVHFMWDILRACFAQILSNF